MSHHPFRPTAFLAGAAAAVLVVFALGLRSPRAPQQWEYKVTDKHSDEILTKLGDQGWEYAGYFGESALGGGEAIGLWKRPK